MDIRSIISEDSDQQFKPSHHAAAKQSPVHSSPGASQHPPPHPYASSAASYGHPVAGQGHSFQQHQYQAAPGGRPSVPTYSRPSPSPYPPLTTTIPSYNAHNQGQPSLSPSSASAQRQTPHSLTESPMSSSSYSHPSTLNHAAQQSHPTTPLGPPLSYNRTSSYISREPQSPYNHQRTLSGASYGASSTTPLSGIKGGMASTASPGVYDSISPNIERNGSEYSTSRERERTVSVSPKTKVPSRSQSMESRHASHDYDQALVTPGSSLRSILHPSQQQQQQPPTVAQSASQSYEQSAHPFHNQSPPPRSSFSQPSPKTAPHPSPKPHPQPSPQPPSRVTNSVSPTTHRLQHAPPPPPPPPPPPVTASKPLQSAPSVAQPAHPQPISRAPAQPPPFPQPSQIPRKRKRQDPIPIWALKVGQQPAQSISAKRQTASPTLQSNGHPPPSINAPAYNLGSESLEPNFANIPPYDDMTRRVMDFLWEYVVDNDAAETEISRFEIEAKLGVLIDRNTNRRLLLPIRNEAVLQEGAFNVMFQSDMSEKYHQTYNKYLNKETAKSNQNPTRVPIKYEHVRETDSFYELPQAGFSLLPDYARRILNPRTTKVRITRDTKTGAILEKLVKAKLANLEIHFPCQELDVRISVNLEIQYTGETQDLEEAREDGRRQASRIKDRMCYHHQFCEVDLTQVTKAEDGVGGKGQPKTHEVEIELDADAVRREGKALQMNGSSRYEELITTFINHVRELVRTQLEPT